MAHQPCLLKQSQLGAAKEKSSACWKPNLFQPLRKCCLTKHEQLSSKSYCWNPRLWLDTLIHILYCPPGRAGRASWQLQCEGLWVFSLLRVRDYGLQTAFVPKNNIGAQRVEASVNNSGSPEAGMFFDVLLSAEGHTKYESTISHLFETDEEASVPESVHSTLAPDRQEGDTARRPDVPMLSLFIQVSTSPSAPKRKEIINTSFHDSVCLLWAILIHIISVLWLQQDLWARLHAFSFAALYDASMHIKARQPAVKTA